MRAALIASMLAVLLLGGCTTDDEPDSPEELLAAASDAMEDESFSHAITDCHACPPPIVREYAPSGAARLQQSDAAYEQFPHAVILNGEGYVSTDGQHWLTNAGGLEFLNLLLSDPRVLLAAIASPELEPAESVDGTEASVVTGELDTGALAESSMAFFPDDAATHEGLRELLDGTRVRFWISREDHRVLQVEVAFPDPDPPPKPMKYDYETPVDIPIEIESMDAEEAQDLRQEAEKAGERILLAIADYRAATGAYPPAVDPATLAGVIPVEEWPTNPFSGQPVRQAPTSPGDIEYTLTHGGEHIQFTVYGWDAGQLHHDSARWGHHEPAELRTRIERDPN